MRACKLTFLALSSFFWPTFALPQGADGGSIPTLPPSVNKTLSHEVGVPTLDSVPLRPDYEVVIEAGAEKQVAKVKFVKPKKDDNTILSLTISSPFKEDETSTDFIDQDGLADTVNAEFAYTHVAWPDRWNPKLTGRNLHYMKMKLCWEARNLTHQPVPGKEKFNAYLNELDLATEMNATKLDNFRKEHQEESNLEAQCDDLETVLRKAQKEIRRSALRQWREETGLDRLVWIWGLKGKAGRKAFEFADAAELDSKSSSRYSYSGTATLGFLIPRLEHRASGLWLSVAAENKYKALDAVTLCKSLEANNLLECKDKVIGEPKQVEGEVYGLEYRQFFEKLAISPKVFYRSDDDVTGVDFPIFFLRDNNKDQNFTGGLRVAWRSDTNDLSASIFIGASLPTPLGGD